MIWLTWRQFRAQAATAVAALAAFAILLAVTRPQMDRLYAASGITGCHGGTCGERAGMFLDQLSNATPFGGPRGPLDLLPDGLNLYPLVYGLAILVILTAPAIIGVFWGARASMESTDKADHLTDPEVCRWPSGPPLETCAPLLS